MTQNVQAYPLTYGGVRIVEDLNMVDTVEDWSRVRSPARARRRLRYGHPQNIVYRTVPKKEAYSIDGGRTIIMHPELVKELRSQISEQIDDDAHALLSGGSLWRESSEPPPLTATRIEEIMRELGEVFRNG